MEDLIPEGVDAEEQEALEAPPAVAAEPEPLTFDDLMAFAPVNETFDIVFPNGKVMKGRVITDTSEVLQIEKHVRATQKTCRSGRVPKAWRPFLPADDEVIRWCCYAEKVLIQPELTFLQALELAKRACVAFAIIGEAMDTNIGGRHAAALDAEVEKAGND